MKNFSGLKKEEMQDMLVSLNNRYEEFISQNLKLDMSRGKPCTEQLELSAKMLDYPSGNDSCKTADGTDCRNYGLVDGIPEAKALFAEMLKVSVKEVIIGGNASLSMMYDTLSRAMMFGVYGGASPWSKLPAVKFLCPSPGYDRHFAICELMGIEMINIEMKQYGPDMDQIEVLVSKDPAIKGIWCTPIYSNPDGITYSDEVVRRLANMNTKAEDFRIFWDCAYIVHHLSDKPDKLLNIMDACKEAGNPDRVYIFSSTSKITFPGAGVAVMASSENNINLTKKQLGIRTIGPDKINQLRHAAFLKDMKGIEDQMKKHAEILKPKFDMVLDILESELGGKNIAWWNKPNGGYFISFNTLPGCAKEALSLASKAGVVMTPAGATYPYGKDPQDRNIRIAPTLPPVSELKKAMELLCICVQIASIKKILNQ